MALGRLRGFSGLELMHFAATVAAVCTFGTLLGMRRIFVRLPAPWMFLLPPALLSVGAWVFMLAIFAAGYAVAPLVRRQWT